MYDKIWAVHSFLMPDGYNLSFVQWKLIRNILINAFSMKTQNKTLRHYIKKNNGI